MVLATWLSMVFAVSFCLIAFSRKSDLHVVHDREGRRFEHGNHRVFDHRRDEMGRSRSFPHGDQVTHSTRETLRDPRILRFRSTPRQLAIRRVTSMEALRRFPQGSAMTEIPGDRSWLGPSQARPVLAIKAAEGKRTGSMTVDRVRLDAPVLMGRLVMAHAFQLETSGRRD